MRAHALGLKLAEMPEMAWMAEIHAHPSVDGLVQRRRNRVFVVARDTCLSSHRASILCRSVTQVWSRLSRSGTWTWWSTACERNCAAWCYYGKSRMIGMGKRFTDKAHRCNQGLCSGSAARRRDKRAAEPTRRALRRD